MQCFMTRISSKCLLVLLALGLLVGVSSTVHAYGFYYSWYPDTLILAPGDSFHVDLMLANDTTTLISYGFRSTIGPTAPFDTLVFDWTGTAAETGGLTIRVGPEYEPTLMEYGGAALAITCAPGVPIDTLPAVHIHGQISPGASPGLYTFAITAGDMADCDGADIAGADAFDGVIRVQGLQDDVGPVAITSPPETVYVDSSHTPQATVRNFGPDTAGPIDIVCSIDTNGVEIWADTGTITALPGDEVDTVTFASWVVPVAYLDYTVTVWTDYPADPATANDTISTSVYSIEFIEDVACTEILAPVDTVVVGSYTMPQVVVENFSPDVIGPIPVICVIDTMGAQIYADTAEVTSLAAGGADTVTFMDWMAPTPGLDYNVTAWTEYPGDTDPANDTTMTSFYVASVIAGTGFYYSWYPDTLELARGDSFHVELMLQNDTTILGSYGFRSFVTPTAPFDTLVFDWTGTAAEVGSLSILVGPEYDPSLYEFGGAAATILCEPGVPLGTHVACHIAGQITTDAPVGFFTFDLNTGDLADCIGTDVAADLYDAVVRVRGTDDDVGPVAILAPPDTVGVDTMYMPEAVVQNFGIASVGPIPVVCSIDTNGVEVYRDSLEITTLSSLAADTVVFSVWTSAVPYQDYTMTVWTAYAGDPDPANDMISKSILSWPVGILDEYLRGPMPIRFALSQNLPNPMRSQATIHYQVPKTSLVRIRIYDSAGRVVRTLLEETKEPGYHRVVWDGRSNDGQKVASGVYFYRMRAGDFMSLKKLVIVR